ncbi:hypothetical protein GE21DRAFT_8536 [Neurospora crassa]|uniref:Uncharacterized protein n=1 Tax=Neurospora crassa (strain ATCC 24698 / 74-OR23-1A / CBS 708.71 / DSM 1257 / FGSC 987) TaxID=367110 RepID=Q7RZ23_NEUCR|nr:hypothetical protein NCU07152 [Neurospora crassa OR74A]EAA28141.1 hypothetical protein NCU07152 [Neurospora crassa OR74A]KHE85824.1 hypothetical protein GE21DRAFT_8536 [Neurospora crassa]|eukprot:XP_957377.1 hypothetical protein NCU07152 [Neurospora crassa OR74A]
MTSRFSPGSWNLTSDDIKRRIESCCHDMQRDLIARDQLHMHYAEAREDALELLYEIGCLPEEVTPNLMSLFIDMEAYSSYYPGQIFPLLDLAGEEMRKGLRAAKSDRRETDREEEKVVDVLKRKLEADSSLWAFSFFCISQSLRKVDRVMLFLQTLWQNCATQTLDKCTTFTTPKNFKLDDNCKFTGVSPWTKA